MKKSSVNWLWPNVSTPEGARYAAKQGFWSGLFVAIIIAVVNRPMRSLTDVIRYHGCHCMPLSPFGILKMTHCCRNRVGALCRGNARQLVQAAVSSQRANPGAPVGVGFCLACADVCLSQGERPAPAPIPQPNLKRTRPVHKRNSKWK